jgi:hypothetical protein
VSGEVGREEASARDVAALAELAARGGLRVGGVEAVGLPAGAHPVVFFVLDDIGGETLDRLLGDHLGADFLDVVPDGFDADPETGLRRWTRDGLEPIAIVGAPETFELGHGVADALPCAAVLFLDRRSAPAPVLGWDRSPVHRLVPIAPALADLDVRDR